MILNTSSTELPATFGPLLSIDEVALILKVDPDTVTRMANRGKIMKPLDLGHRTKRYRRSDIEFWIEHGCKSAAVTRSLKESEGK